MYLLYCNSRLCHNIVICVVVCCGPASEWAKNLDLERMANFSSYASKFLNQSLLPSSSVVTTNEPLFYSMAESHEGDLDDEEDPHLQRSRDKGAHDYDPFNLEDIPDNEREEDAQDGLSLGNTRESLPLLLQSGWRQSQPRDPRPPSPPRSVDEEESDDDDELAFGLQMFEDDRPPQRTGQGLTESLLPRNAGDGTPFVFSLPKPDRVGRMKFNDVAWATVWRVSLATCAVGSVVTLFIPSVCAIVL